MSEDPLRFDVGGVLVHLAQPPPVSRILEIGEQKREQYETFSPVFWKKATTPRETFAPYLLAQCGNPAEGYVDDYAVAAQTADWFMVSVALLA